MKRQNSIIALFLTGLVAPGLLLTPCAQAAVKTDTVTLNTTADWSDAALPDNTKIGVFDATLSANNATNLSMGGDISLLGLQFTTNAPWVAITSTNNPGGVLTLGSSGILVESTNLVQIGPEGANSVALAANQTWTNSNSDLANPNNLYVGNVDGGAYNLNIGNANSAASVSGFSAPYNGTRVNFFGESNTLGNLTVDSGSVMVSGSLSASTVVAGTSDTYAEFGLGANAGTTYVQSLLLTNSTVASGNNTLRLEGGHLVTSNAPNADALVWLLPYNTQRGIDGAITMNGGTNTVASLQTESDFGGAWINMNWGNDPEPGGPTADGDFFTVNSGAVLNIGNMNSATANNNNGNIRIGENAPADNIRFTVNGGEMNSYGYNIRLGNNGSTNHLVITNGGKFTRILGNSAAGIEIGRTAGATDNELIVTGPTSSADFGGKYVALWRDGGGNNRILVDDGALMTNVSILRVNGGNSYASITNGGRVYCTSTDVGGNYAISAARLTVGGGTGTSWLDVGGGTIQIGSDTHAADQCSVTLLSGGVITNAGVRLESFSGQVNVFNFNGGTLVAKAGGSLITTNGPTADSCKVYIQAGGAVINDNGFNASLFYTPLLEDPSSTGGGLTKLGSGELALNNPSGYTYTGLTTVSEGALRVSSFIVGSVSVASGATLSGPGNIGGSATVAGTLSPGTAGIASMDITNNLTLSGDTFIELNKDLAPSTTNDVVNVLGTLTYGGTLTITNIGASALALGDSFRVFPAGGGSSFATVQGDAGSGLAFEFNDGVVSVVSAVVTQPDLGYTVSGGAITFTWDNTGGPFTLEAQTNGLGTGLSTNWFPYPNGTNGVSVSIQPGNPSVFFRLSN